MSCGRGEGKGFVVGVKVSFFFFEFCGGEKV